MALNSVNTNTGALVALQSLNRTNDEMAVSQKRISTGLRVADAKDDGAAFAVAQKVRADIAGLTSANEQLGGVKGILDTTMSALTKVSNTMKDIRTTLTKLADGNVAAGSAERNQYTEQLKKQIEQVNNYFADATYNGQNLLKNVDTAAATPEKKLDISAVRNEAGTSYKIDGTISGTGNVVGNINKSLTLDDGSSAGTTKILAMTEMNASQAKFLLGDTSASVTANLKTGAGSDAITDLGDGTDAAITTFTEAEKNINNALNTYSSHNKYVDSQISYNKEKMDALEGGLGALVDADLAKESARMQSLQIRQQLGTTALSTANQAPQALLSLFR